MFVCDPIQLQRECEFHILPKSVKSVCICASYHEQRIKIVEDLDANFSYLSPVCQFDQNIIPIFSNGSSIGIMSINNGAEIDELSGLIKNTNLASGSYQVINRIDGEIHGLFE